MTFDIIDERTSGSASRGQALALPAGVDRRRIDWVYALSVVGCHVVAMLAFWPWFFSWTGVVLAILGLYVFGTLGINLCYHRLLTHRGLVVPRPLEYVFAVLGVCCMQDTPAHWAAVHRRHHEHADDRPDPHSPLVNFLWGHIGWLLVENAELRKLRIFERYSKDILRDRFYRWLERGRWLIVVLASWLIFFGAGVAAALALGGNASGALQFGLSLLIWGVFVRTVLVWHITWSVNSFAHLWGYRNYETDEESRNNVFVGIISNGEGWHNNHHADPRSAKHGHRWWELDVTFLTIRLLMLLGLARNVAMPRASLASQSNAVLATRVFEEHDAG
jgi:fatty-acid desaturase